MCSFLIGVPSFSFAMYVCMYVGVSWDVEHGKWKSKLHVRGRSYHLGRFDSEIDAAEAHDA